MVPQKFIPTPWKVNGRGGGGGGRRAVSKAKNFQKYEAKPEFPQNEENVCVGEQICSRTVLFDFQFLSQVLFFLVMIWNGTASCSTP